MPTLSTSYLYIGANGGSFTVQVLYGSKTASAIGNPFNYNSGQMISIGILSIVASTMLMLF